MTEIQFADMMGVQDSDWLHHHRVYGSEIGCTHSLPTANIKPQTDG
jgi:hypothetical protein